MLFRTLILRIAALGFVKKLVTKSRLFAPLVSRFIAGDTARDAVRTAENLAAKGLYSTLDLLGENVATKEEAEASVQSYIDLVQLISKSSQRDKINISIKLTALGLDQGMEFCESNYRKLLTEAKKEGIFVCADMESSEYTDRTLQIVEKVFPDFPESGTVVQSMLRRTEADVDRLIKLGCKVRMVKGAYLEASDVAYQDKGEVDFHYVHGAKKLLEHGSYPAIASHDEKIISELMTFAKEKGISQDAFEWQMLYGIRRDRQDSLVAEGWRMRVYVPFGTRWYPYFSRRLAERPQNLFFITRAALGK